MQKIFDVGEKLFFYILTICLLSFIYFTVFPKNEMTIAIGFIFCIFYFGVNFYIGYKYSLTIEEACIVGGAGCGLGIFLSFFSLYSYFALKSTYSAIWIITPYFMPTMSMINIFHGEVTIVYPFILMVINILLVIIGSIVKKIMNNLLAQSK